MAKREKGSNWFWSERGDITKINLYFNRISGCYDKVPSSGKIKNDRLEAMSKKGDLEMVGFQKYFEDRDSWFKVVWERDQGL